MNIYVKTLTGRVLSLQITPGITVLQVKQMIEDLDGIPVQQQRLIFRGKQLQNSRFVKEDEAEKEFTLSDYEVPMEGEIHLVLHMR
jgi:large subunit ribosomal protein L40e